MVGKHYFGVACYLLFTIGSSSQRAFAGLNQSMDMSEKEWLPATPFTRLLQMTDPLMQGKDVVILQNLLRRQTGVFFLNSTGIFDSPTAKALQQFQRYEGLPQQNGVLDIQTGIRVVQNLIHDGYRDKGLVPDNCKFFIHMPIHMDRTKESTATLFKCGDGGRVLHKFTVRTRGSTKHGQPLNQLTSNGDTPTGYATLDLNSPEPKKYVKKFGPWPVLRVVKGIEGNVALGKDTGKGKEKDTFLSNYRFGILLHSGIWDGWDPSKPMPNSNGCIHVHPNDHKIIVDMLVQETAAVINKNPFGTRPYPFETQGFISIEEIY